MKKLKNHVIFYDEVCPMCHVYTKAFVKTGMLDADSRAPYQRLSPTEACYIDEKRAVAEIALLNQETGEVTYGVKSLMKILSNACSPLRLFAACPPFMWVMDKFYKFVSYNRRIIIPAQKTADTAKYEPPLRLQYRMAYLVVTWLVTAAILNRYSIFLTGLIPAGSFYREILICGGQLVWQGSLLFLLYKRLDLDYLGNMMTISFGGGLLLLPAFALHQLIKSNTYVFAAYFLLVAGAMFIEHRRRVKLLGLHWMLTAGWIAYRIIVLIVIS
jgi:predicted DCC family thiol-disulfide oxidoreductase YuxK